MACDSNLNPLFGSYFTLRFGRGTKSFELLCQKANIPGCVIPNQPQPTIYGTTIPVPTMQFQYETLNTEFIIDSTLENWLSMYSWMRNLANIADDTTDNLPYQDWHHQAVLTIYSPVTNCPVQQVTFRYIVPQSLGGINFQTDLLDATPLRATCVFKFSYMELSPDAPSNLKNSN